MNRLKIILKWALLIWGSVSLVGVILLALGMLALNWDSAAASSKQITKRDTATATDVRFVLNWCELGDQRIDSVVHSVVSPSSFNGDHLDAYAIKVKNLSLGELSKAPWVTGNSVQEPLLEALRLTADSIARDEHWFPTSTEILTENYHIYAWSVVLRRNRPTAAQLIIARPTDGMVFYVSMKT